MTNTEPREAAAPPALVYVIGTYPLLTTTFVDREIELLRWWGVSLDVISLRRPSRQRSKPMLSTSSR